MLKRLLNGRYSVRIKLIGLCLYRTKFFTNYLFNLKNFDMVNRTTFIFQFTTISDGGESYWAADYRVSHQTRDGTWGSANWAVSGGLRHLYVSSCRW